MTFLPNPSDPGAAPPDCVVLALPAELDFCNAMGLLPLIMAAVRARADARTLVLDLTTTHFMDSQGVRLLDEVALRLPGRVRLRVAADPEGVTTRVLELTGLRRDVPVYDSLAEAVRPGEAMSFGPRG
ncbi:STAS domain-containing protein [Streptomyces sp. NPDC048182]|uniref:STAS domain-containing protein n=1 Tax=Streptomyces sp. NPDC048182 TaxID=3365507 RepID=UPI0037152F04